MEIEKIESKIIIVRDQKVILDKDVVEIYGVEIKRINEAVKNNPHQYQRRNDPPYLGTNESITYV